MRASIVERLARGMANPVRSQESASRLLRTVKRIIAFLVALCACGVLTPVASGYVYTDIINFNLTGTASTYGYFSISTIGDGAAYYRWVDDPAHSTIISANRCSDLALLGSASIAAHDTSYSWLFTGGASACFALRGRTAPGAGSMYYYDGRLQR